MDCMKFVDELDKEFLPYETVLELEKHAKRCWACKTLLDYWSLNQLTELVESGQKSDKD